MLIDEAAVDYVSAPRDYDECFRMYRGYLVSLVTKMGIDESRAEDVVHEILLAFYARDFLAVFDPTLNFEHQGEMHKARFKSFLTKFALKYVKGHRDKQNRLTSREVLIMDSPNTAGSHMGSDLGTTWGEQYGEACPSAEDELLGGGFGVEEIRDRLRRHIAEVKRRSPFDTCDLAKLLEEVFRQIDEYGAWDVNELRMIFGVSSTAMHAWLWRLRESCAAALNCRLPPKRSHRGRRP